MTISKSENLSAQISVNAPDGSAKPVANTFATVDGNNMAVNIGVTVTDKTSAANSANTAAIVQQYGEFIAAVRDAAAGAGLNMFANPTV